MEDEIIVKRLQNGDRSAFDELYNMYKNEALRTSFLITGNLMDSEDVVQQAFVQCYQTINQLKDAKCFKGWFFRILTRIAWQSNRYKRKVQPVDEFFDDAQISEESALDTVLRNEQSRLLYSYVQRLEEKQKTVIILYYYNQMSIKEIAKILSCREGTVKSRLFAARRNLQKNIDCAHSEKEGVLL